MSKVRITQHNGRRGKDGVYNPSHNDRTFLNNIKDTKYIAPNIDLERSKNNWYWTAYGQNVPFREAEYRFYNEHFADHLTYQNKLNEKRGHRERNKTVADLLERYPPEEVILTIGNVKDSVGIDVQQACLYEYILWEMDTFGSNLKTLDIALHVDEEGNAHIHQRRVWLGKDKGGNLVPSENKALCAMNIERPDKTKPEGRYNNRKITFSKICRDKLLDICREYVEIEEQPRERSKSGLNLIEYKARQTELNLERIKSESQTKLRELREISLQVEQVKEQLELMNDVLHKAEIRQIYQIVNREHERVR